MKERWSIYDMDVLCHYHSRCCWHDGRDLKAPAYDETLAMWLRLGLLEFRDDSEFPQTTPLGGALIEAWKRTPIPEQKFVDPRSGEILEDHP